MDVNEKGPPRLKCFVFPMPVYVSMNACTSLPEKYISTEVSLKPCSHETFITWGPQVINELSATPVVCELYGETIKIHKNHWWPGYNNFTFVTA